MRSDEAGSLGRAIGAVRRERGLTQLKLAKAVGVSVTKIGHWERAQVPEMHGVAAHHPELTRDQLSTIATALGCEPADIADRAALTATTRVALGLEPLGPARTVIAGHEIDLTDAEAERVLDFIAGLIAYRSGPH